MPRQPILFCCALALWAASACVPSAEEAEEFGENSPMAAIQEAGELVVAVPQDAPPFSSSAETGAPRGFVVDLARDLATALDVEVRYVETSSEEMAEMVAGPDPVEIGDEEADIAFPLTTVTYEIYRDVSREQGFDLTTPFFIGHQRLLVPGGSDITSADDLSGRVVCSVVDPEVGLPLDTIAPEAEAHDASTLEGCASSLAEDQADAVMGSEVDLLRVTAELDRLSDKEGPDGEQAIFEIVGDELTTQGYAPYVVKGMTAFSSDVFSEAQDDGNWAEAYESWVAPLTEGVTTEPPELTLQEAAALYPIED